MFSSAIHDRGFRERNSSDLDRALAGRGRSPRSLALDFFESPESFAGRNNQTVVYSREVNEAESSTSRAFLTTLSHNKLWIKFLHSALGATGPMEEEAETALHSG